MMTIVIVIVNITSLVLCEDSIFNTLHHEDVRLVIDYSGNNP